MALAVVHQARILLLRVTTSWSEWLTGEGRCAEVRETELAEIEILKAVEEVRAIAWAVSVNFADVVRGEWADLNGRNLKGCIGADATVTNDLGVDLCGRDAWMEMPERASEGDCRDEATRA